MHDFYSSYRVISYDIYFVFPQIAQSSTLKQLKKAMQAASEFLQVAGCWRRVTELTEKTLLLDDILNFYLVIRMQLPLQRFVTTNIKVLHTHITLAHIHISRCGQ